MNKDRYESTKAGFEKISNELILEISKFDDEIKHVNSKDCIFRIYRDTRFSSDKTPYKTHYGVFIAAAGGRKSIRGGYYIHLEPQESFIAAGVWCPPPELLKHLRQSIYDNIDEFKEIIHQRGFKAYFRDFYQDDKLKTAPKGFPKDFPEIEYLKLKHYMVEYKPDDSILQAENFPAKVAEILKNAYPLNRFLNYTVDEANASH